MLEYNLFNKHQDFYHRSTSQQLLKTMDEWTSELDQGNTIETTYMDFKRPSTQSHTNDSLERQKAMELKDHYYNG